MSKKILITGANGGFGQLTVKSLLQEGHKVTASMRNVQDRNRRQSEELAGLGAAVVEMDVTQDASVDAGGSDSSTSTSSE